MNRTRKDKIERESIQEKQFANKVRKEGRHEEQLEARGVVGMAEQRWCGGMDEPTESEADLDRTLKSGENKPGLPTPQPIEQPKFWTRRSSNSWYYGKRLICYYYQGEELLCPIAV